MQYKDAEIGETVYFWFAANTTAGAAGDGATPLYDVRLAGAAAGAAPTASGTPTLLTHADYTDGLHEIAIVTTAWAAGEYAVFCSLTISTVNPAGFVGSFKLVAVGESLHASTKEILTRLPDATAGAANGLMILGTNTGTPTFSNGVIINGGTNVDALTLTAAATGSGLKSTGNTTGHGIYAVSGGGATGDGIKAESVATSGNGFYAQGVGTGSGIKAGSGTGLAACGILAVSAGTGPGIYAWGAGTNSAGIYAQGNGTASGITALGGATGPGILATGGGNDAAADGMRLVAGGATASGLEITGGSVFGATTMGTLTQTGAASLGVGSTVTFATLGVTGALSVGTTSTFTGAVTYSNGIVVAGGTGVHAVQLTGAATGHGLIATGGTTGSGIYATSGTTGSGIKLLGGATSGAGLDVRSQAGTGGANYAAYFLGNATGADTGGIYCQGGATGGDGMELVASGNGHGLYAIGSGTGDGFHAKSGTGNGAHGFHCEAVGAGVSHGLLLQGNTGGDDLHFAGAGIVNDGILTQTGASTYTGAVSFTNGIVVAGGTSTHAVTLTGAAGGYGLSSTGGTGNSSGALFQGVGTGHGAVFAAQNVAAGGNGIYASGGQSNAVNNGNGIYAVGGAAGTGIVAAGGASGHGIYGLGGTAAVAATFGIGASSLATTAPYSIYTDQPLLINATSVASVAVAGNASIGGTMTYTGAVSYGSTETHTGAVVNSGGITTTTWAASGAVTAASLTLSGVLQANSLVVSTTTDLTGDVHFGANWHVVGTTQMQGAVTHTGTTTYTGAFTLTDVTTAGTVGKIMADTLADTNELQTDWVNGGRLDLILDAAGAAGDPWVTLIPGSYTAGMAGYILGNNINASISSRSSHSAADVVTAIGTGSTLTALATAAELLKVPKSDSNVTWNVTALASIQAECTDALNAYDPPTNTEMEARTLVAASYATASALTTVSTAVVTTIPGTITTLTTNVATIDTLLDKFAPLVIGTISGAGTASEVFVHGGVTATVVADASGNRSSVTFS